MACSLLLFRHASIKPSNVVPVSSTLSILRFFSTTASTPASTVEGSSSPPPPPHTPPPSGPLVGYRVLDLGQVVAGNFCSALLAYFGAEVIKVEPPSKGDALRHLRHLDDTGCSLWWRSYGRNRKCVTINLHEEKGRELVKKLANNVDILVENFRPGVMEKWGLGPTDLSPSLIYTRISGYGQTGPKAPNPGYASVCEAYGGFRYLNGYPDRAPVRPNISLGDSLAGLHAAFGAVMALLHQRTRNNTKAGATAGVAAGQVVDAAISESLFNMLEGCVPEYVASGAVRPPSGSTLTGVVPSGCWKASDGVYVIIGGNGNSVYNRLMAAIGRPDMGIENARYATDSKRVEHEQEICAVIEAWVAENSSHHVMEVLQGARVPAGTILSIADIMAEEQYRARGMFEEMGGGVTVPAMVPVLSGTPGKTRWAGPELGEHTEEVLREELGMGAEEIGALREQGVV